MASVKLHDKLFDAVEEANFAGIQRLIKQGADINAINAEGQTPVSVACYTVKGFNANRIVKLFIKHGADLNKYRKGGYTPLISAVLASRVMLVQTLLEEGANPNINCFPHRSPQIVSTALDLVYMRYLEAIIKEKKGFFDDENVLQREIYACKAMMFLLTEAGARRHQKDVVPEYS